MTDEEIIDQLIFDESIMCQEVHLDSACGLYVRLSDAECILVKNNLDAKERIWAKAHELGHARARQNTADKFREALRQNERFADRYAYELVMPASKLIRACELGIDDLETLSDFLMITPERITAGLQLYAEIHGPEHVVDGWRIRFLPLSIEPVACTGKAEKQRLTEEIWYNLQTIHR